MPRNMRSWRYAQWQTSRKVEKWKKKTCRTKLMLHRSALLLFLNTVQGARSELAGHDSVNRKAAKQTNQVKKNINQPGRSDPKCKSAEWKRGWGNGSLLHLHIFNEKIAKKLDKNQKRIGVTPLLARWNHGIDRHRSCALIWHQQTTEI